MRRQQPFVKIPFFFLSLILYFLACKEPEVKLDRQTRIIIDSVVVHKIDSLRPIWDSLCVQTREQKLNILVDSIVLERRKKEERLRMEN